MPTALRVRDIVTDPANLWLTSAWGFTPKKWGCFGFTSEQHRTSFIKNTSPGCLVFFYITKSKGPKPERGKLVGIMEVSHDLGSAESFMSADARQDRRFDKEDRHKWNYAVRATRAWRISESNLKKVKAFLPKTFGSAAAQFIGARGMPIHPHENEKLLDLIIEPAELFAADRLTPAQNKTYNASSVADLSSEARSLLNLLVANLRRITAGKPETYLTYGEIHSALSLTRRGPTYGASLQHQGLNELAHWTKSHGHPAVTGLIVSSRKDRKNPLRPGTGYFSLFDRSPTDERWWAQQISLATTYDWSPFLADDDDSGSAVRLIEPEDCGSLPKRVEAIVYRLLRDTATARLVKSMHSHRCQLCRSTIILPNGKRYAEAHHIRPLGGKHTGPDIAANILCLCPTHHVQLDYGVIPLRRSSLHTVPSHNIEDQYIEYHNKFYKYPPDRR